MEIIYRRWRVEDLTFIPEVIWKTWIDAYSSFIPVEDLRAYHSEFYNAPSMKKLFEDPNVNAFVAEAEGNVVGALRTKFNKDEQRHYVSSLYILPQFQKLGIGRSLMRMAASEARSRTLDRVWLGVMVENKPALHWYRKMGFEIVEEAPFQMGKTSVEHYIGYVMLSSIDKVERSREHPLDR